MASPFQPAAKSATTSSVSPSDDAIPIASSSMSKPSQSDPPPVPPLHLACQTGDLNALAELLPAGGSTEPGAVTANDRDAQGITALHWAAINNHVVACKFLLERGAEVDAVGGDLEATPLHWAARNGHLYIVHLLLKYNADPNLLDSQSFNALHLSVHSSAPFLLAYMLFTSQPIAVDSSDTEGHTALHWACYQGDALSVDLLLRAGADPTRADNAGLTPLHWAAVKGNAACIERLVEAGADQYAKEKQGKTPRDMATELKSLGAFKRALVEAGCDEDGRKRSGPLSPRNTKLAILLLPTGFFFLILNTIAILPWWSGFLLAAAEFFAMHHIVTKVLLDMSGPVDQSRLTKSPYLCAIITSSLFWVLYVWLTRFINGAPGYAVTNLLFGISILVCSYNFFRAITLNPGHVPPPANDSELKDMIEELVESGNLNGMNFCLPCMTRRPLRSKHSHVTGKCTARFDHYCPWVWNDVGVNNHRQFLLFVTSLVVGVCLYIRLAIGYFSENAPTLPAETCTWPGPLCEAGTYDSFALAVVCWAALQLTWTSLLLGAQLWQICRQMTTLEVSNVSRYGFMGGRPGVSAAAQQGFVDKATDADGQHVHGPNCDHSGSKKKKPSFLLKILGIDRFTRGEATKGLTQASSTSNPFDLGLISNCFDFWTRGRKLGVDYTNLYEVPDGGFRKALRDRKRREKDEREVMGTRAGAKGKRPSGAGGYERVAMDEV